MAHDANVVRTSLKLNNRNTENVKTTANNVNTVSISLWLTMYPAIIGKVIRAIDPEAENNPCSVPCGIRPTTCKVKESAPDIK